MTPFKRQLTAETVRALTLTQFLTACAALGLSPADVLHAVQTAQQAAG